MNIYALGMSPFLLTTAAETSQVVTTHMTLGEIMVSVSTIVLVVATVILTRASMKVEKATIMDANTKLADVANRSNDNMADVAETALRHRDDDGDLDLKDGE